VCAFRLRIEQDLRESRCSGHESWGGERPQRLGLIEGLLNLSGCSLVDRTLSLFGYMCFVVGYFSNVFQFVKVIGKLNILDGAIIFEKVYT
jgi:hypothetical protein